MEQGTKLTSARHLVFLYGSSLCPRGSARAPSGKARAAERHGRRDSVKVVSYPLMRWQFICTMEGLFFLVRGIR